MIKKIVVKLKNLFKKQAVAIRTLEDKAEELISDLSVDVRSFEKQAEDALSLFKSTVGRLENISGSIVKKRMTVNTYIQKLNELDSDLAGKAQANDKVLTKFKEFLN